MDGLPAFFANGSVDDTKYESLLADLRAHDLLGPVESGAQASEGGTSSLFFNDAFSAVFMGTFESESVAKSSRAPPGLAPPSEDLKWARGQQKFSRLEEQFHGSKAEAQNPNKRALPPGLSLEDTELDESQIPGLKGLGLDDDDTGAVQLLPPQAPPPLPPRELMPPMPPTPPANAYAAPPLPPQTMAFRPPLMYVPPHPPGVYPSSLPQYGHGSPLPQAYGYTNGVPVPMQMPVLAFQMMTPRDVHFVIQQQMKWLRSSDPFSDDYYFHHFMQKRTRTNIVGRSSIPLPSWKLQHVKSIDPRDVQREVKSRNWEAEYHVLGRNAKSSLYRPKQLLNLATSSASPIQSEESDRCTHVIPPFLNDASSMTAESSSEATSSSLSVRNSTRSPGAQTVALEAQGAKVLRMTETANRRSVFSNATWTLRVQIDRGMHCLLSLQEARHLLDARGIHVQQFHCMKKEDMDPPLAALRLRTTSLLMELAGLVGVKGHTIEDKGRPRCDVVQVEKMLSVKKGKVLVSRALPLLYPSARFVLLPYLVDLLLAARAVAGRLLDKKDPEDDRLCQTLVLLLLYVPPAPSATLLTEWLQRAVSGHTVESLSLVLHNRAKAEALQALLKCGGAAIQQLAETDGSDVKSVKERWEYHQNVFVQLATAMTRSE